MFAKNAKTRADGDGVGLVSREKAKRRITLNWRA